jgi:vitamin B12 transporter
MFRVRFPALFCAFSCGCAAAILPARAQAPIMLEGVVITADRISESAEKVGSAVTVISREQIEASRAENVAELLETVPGLNVNQSGGVGGTSNIYIRGADPDHTQVLIDGVRVNDPAQASGEFDFSLFTLGNIERIEVLRGPQSGLYGSAAIGGVINIVTRKGEGPLQGTMEAEGGSYNTHAERGAVSGSKNGVAISAAASNFRTSGFSRSTLGTEADSTEKQSANLRMDMDFTPNAGITVSLGRYRVDAETDTSPQRGENDKAEKVLSIAAVTGRLDLWDGLVSNKVTLFANKTERNFFEDDVSVRSGLQPQTDLFDGNRVGIEAQSDITVRAVDRLTVGGRAERETAEQITETLAGRSLAFSGEERTSAAFALYQFNPIETLTLTAAGRAEDFGSAGIEETYRFTGSFRIPQTETKLRGSIGTGAKAPTLSERFLNTSFAVGNPDLSVETSKGFDFGVDQKLLDGKVMLSATYFRNDIRDLIEFFDADGFGVGEPGTFENIDAARTRGLELAATILPTAWLTLDLAYTHLDAIDADTGAPLQRRPEHTASARVTLRPTDKARIAASMIYVGERFNGSDRRDPLDDYIRVDLTGSYALHENAEVFLRVENLTDAHYEEIKDFGIAGRSAYAGLRARF